MLADVVANIVTVMRKTGAFKVRKVQLKNNGYAYTQWKVEGTINGVRHRKHFGDRDAAYGYKAEMDLKALNETNVVRVTASHLAPDQLRDAEAALRRLAGRYSLTMAVDWFLRTYRDTLTEKTLEDAYPLFLEDRGQHVRTETLGDYRSSLLALCACYGDRKLPDIGTAEVDAFLKGRGLKGKAWNNTRGDLNAFFAWAEKAPRKWISANPVKDVQKFKVVQGLPEILSADTVCRIFEFLESYTGTASKQHAPGFLVPYFALAVFAGIRPSINGGELTRIAELKNRDRIIDLKAGVIRITPEIAKTKDVRQILIQPNLAAWLERYPLKDFPIIPRNAIELIREVRTRHDVGHDVLRHTFISMHVAKFRSMGDTALQAGNSEKMIKKHYLNLVTTDEAEEFWNVMPKTTTAAEKPVPEKTETVAAVGEDRTDYGAAA
ncbi:MAG: tyrosine-type recombinase/integrase [Opitutaceae bacterium]